jgi:syntaxin 16
MSIEGDIHLQGDKSRVPADGQKALLASGADVEMASVHYDLPPVWVETVEQINQSIKKINEKLPQLQEAHAKHLRVGFDDFSGDSREAEIEATTSEISRLFKLCETKIRFLSSKSSSSKEKTVLHNMQSNLAVQLSQLYSQFRKSQKQYVSRLQGQEQFTSDNIQIDDDDDVDQFGFTSHQQDMVALNDEMLKERQEEIQRIAASIEDLAVLFKDLQNLVIDQGTILDRIDYNIEQATANVEEAVVQLKKAEDHQKKSKLMLCIYLLAILIGGLAVGLIIKKTQS